MSEKIPHGLNVWAHEAVSIHSGSNPSALALSDPHQQLNFAELEQRANRLARHIQRLGVGLDTPVGLYFDRSVQFVVAALAVLKAGGAYVPLDTAYPPNRVAEILKDAGAPVLLSHKGLAANLAIGDWKILDLDLAAPSIAAESAESLATQVAGHNLAYIVYTSGSTGRPKGVEVTHANLCHLIRWHVRAFSVTPTDSASQIAGLAFDAAVWEIWCHLAAGASLQLIDENSRHSPDELQAWLIAKSITIAFVPTILAEHLIALEWPAGAALRVLLTGADTLHRYPNPGLPFTLVNNYGPTECTVLVTSGAVASASNGQIPSIGRPIDDTEILILNGNLARVAAGEEGEICVAGPQIARGYRNLPELTTQKFTTEPGTGLRIYRTGDRGRILPSGEVAFLGRFDDQIKIRGFRVELDEIAAHLNVHPQIRNSVVAALADKSDEKSLVAYLVPAPGSELTAVELKRHLRQRLPDYMVPSTYVSLASLPVTTTGKCDKRALPPPTPANVLPELREFAAASAENHNDTEARIAQMVSALMGGRPIHRDDNFFLVGGHSMLAAQLLARVRESMSITLSLRQLFEAPTIAALAAAVDRKLAAK